MINWNGERKGIEQKFYSLCQTVVESDCNLKLYDLEYIPGNQLLRLFIMDPETNSAVIEDCMKVDRALTPFIEEEEWMPSELVLEVSSPGVYRHLREKSHFEAAIGKNIGLQLRQKLDQLKYADLPKRVLSQRNITGELLACNGETLTIKYQEKEIEIEFNNLKKAHLED